MCTEDRIRTAAAVLFITAQAAEDFRFYSVNTMRTLLCAGAAFAADVLCLVFKSGNCLSPAGILQVFLIAGCMLIPSAFPVRGIGAGDGITWLVLGLLVGPAQSLYTLFFAGILCSLGGLLLMAAGKADRKTEHPFLVYAAAGLFICCFLERS